MKNPTLAILKNPTEVVSALEKKEDRGHRGQGLPQGTSFQPPKARKEGFSSACALCMSHWISFFFPPSAQPTFPIRPCSLARKSVPPNHVAFALSLIRSRGANQCCHCVLAWDDASCSFLCSSVVCLVCQCSLPEEPQMSIFLYFFILVCFFQSYTWDPLWRELWK